MVGIHRVDLAETGDVAVLDVHAGNIVFALRLSLGAVLLEVVHRCGGNPQAGALAGADACAGVVEAQHIAVDGVAGKHKAGKAAVLIDLHLGDVLCLNRAAARISVGERSGLRVPAAAVHYLKEDGTEAQTQGENYIPGVYVKLGNIARFCPIDPVDADHPLITDGDYILVLPEGTEGSVSKVRLYDEIIVSGQNLYDGKLL